MSALARMSFIHKPAIAIGALDPALCLRDLQPDPWVPPFAAITGNAIAVHNSGFRRLNVHRLAVLFDNCPTGLGPLLFMGQGQMRGKTRIWVTTRDLSAPDNNCCAPSGREYRQHPDLRISLWPVWPCLPAQQWCRFHRQSGLSPSTP